MPRSRQCSLSFLWLLSAAALAGCGSPAHGNGPSAPVAEDADPGGHGGGAGGASPADARTTADGAGAAADAQTGDGGSGGSAPDAGAGSGSDGGAGPVDGGGPPAARFSFFVTSLAAMRELSGSQNGFGGDLRFGEATGLAGADKICRTIAEKALPGAGQKTWRAFLSASTGGGPNGGPSNAIDRIGEGPWYDRMGRLVSMNRAGLLAGPRPQAAPEIVNDLPNENGIPNKQGTDNHDTLTGSDKMGRFTGATSDTCNDWTSAAAATGRPHLGHTWPRNPGSISSGAHWIYDHTAPGCAPGVNIGSSGGTGGSGTVGGGGGYGGIYCFALSP
jgi:hypothetical protein